MEITVEPAGKHLTVSDLCLMAFTCFELNLAFQVHVTAGKQPEFYVLVDGADREPEFGMFHNDLIRGMTLPDQRGNDRINAVEILP